MGESGTRMDAAVRASHLKDDLATLSILGEEAEQRVRSRLPPATIGAIEQATRGAFLPVELNAELADAVYAEAGPVGARAWGRSSIIHALGTPLLQGLVRTATALLGLTPTAYFKYAPLAWNAIYHDCGELAVQFLGPTEARIAAGPLPPSLTRIGYTTALAGTFEGAFSFCKVRGEVALDAAPSAHAGCVYVATWRP